MIDFDWLVNGLLFGFGMVAGFALALAVLDGLVRKFGRPVL